MNGAKEGESVFNHSNNAALTTLLSGPEKLRKMRSFEAVGMTPEKMGSMSSLPSQILATLLQCANRLIYAETEAPFLTLHRRDGAGFRRETISGAEAMLDLPEAGITLPLAELYRDAG